MYSSDKIRQSWYGSKLKTNGHGQYFRGFQLADAVLMEEIDFKGLSGLGLFVSNIVLCISRAPIRNILKHITLHSSTYLVSECQLWLFMLYVPQFHTKREFRSKIDIMNIYIILFKLTPSAKGALYFFNYLFIYQDKMHKIVFIMFKIV